MEGFQAIVLCLKRHKRRSHGLESKSTDLKSRGANYGHLDTNLFAILYNNKHSHCADPEGMGLQGSRTAFRGIAF